MTSPWQKPFRGAQINPAHPLARHVTGCWVMNEVTGDMVYDSSGNHTHGVNYGAAWVSNGLRFAGAERVDLPVGHINNHDAFTISAKFNGAAGGIVYSEGYSGDANWALFMGIEANPPYSARFYYKENGAWKGLTTGTTPVNDGWHVVSLSQMNKSYRTIYIDGVPEEVDTDTVGDMTTLDTANIGVLERNTFGSYFVGDIAYVHLHDHGFNDVEAKLYNRNPHGLFEQPISPATLFYEAAPPVGAIINQFQGANIGADLFNGALL